MWNAWVQKTISGGKKMSSDIICADKIYIFTVQNHPTSSFRTTYNSSELSEYVEVKSWTNFHVIPGSGYICSVSVGICRTYIWAPATKVMLLYHESCTTFATSRQKALIHHLNICLLGISYTLWILFNFPCRQREDKHLPVMI